MREQQSHYRIIFEHSSDAIFLIDPQADAILETNPKADELLGYGHQELHDLNPAYMFDEPTEFKKFTQQVMQNDTGRSEDFHLKTRKGDLISVEISASGFADRYEGPLLLCIVRDITERRKSEKRMAQLQQRKQWILQSAGEGIFGLDQHGKITFLNPIAATSLGFLPEELEGRPLLEGIRHANRHGVEYTRETCPIFASIQKGLTMERDDDFFRKKDGSLFPVEYVSTPGRDETGKVVGAVITFKDITQRKKAELDLRESENRFRTIFNSVGDAIFIKDLETGETIDANRKMCEMFGYSYQEMLRMEINVLSENHDEKALQKLRSFRDKASAGLSQNFEWRVRRRSGNAFWVEVHMKRAKIGDKERLLVVLHDISLRKEAEKEVKELNKELEKRVRVRTAQLEATQAELVEKAHRAGMADIATSVLHNVGNVLTSVSTSSQMISKVLKTPTVDRVSMANQLLCDCFKASYPNTKNEKLVRYYSCLEKSLRKERDTIRENSRRIQAKVEVIRDVIHAQQTYATRGFQKEESTLAEVIEEALAIQKNDIINHQVKVNLNLDNNPKIHIHKNKLIHVVVDLIKNACEAMPDRKQMTISTETDHQHVYLKISDTGRGILPEHLNRIFNHGFTTKKNCLGFGLHACANAMTEMGGVIKVESKGLNMGATFTLQFNLEKQYQAVS